ncbi:S-layer homology domain-containing protein [Anaerocolumna xylanovorans]|uniref:S-layer homology domain-containing protein n=1 Tax=Anaerocolumna xylanovorans DSM 12503 TaxID=1121345 RepID=A0A1M7YMA7_9FIRM|nr:S-layer homology domain-containing protein [Anaerocolumna xylanovorans]SHO53749.1 S-layer homology domain-containing protein [Anaerocolumna xylanovorans DSM 12503]
MFGKWKFVARAFVAAVILLLCTTTVSYAEFNDISQDSWYAGAVNRVTALGLMRGNEDEAFKPKGYITREQFAKIIVMAAGYADEAKALKGTRIFDDVKAGTSFNGYVAVAYKKGIMKGITARNFSPEEDITFSQACIAIVRVLGFSEKNVPDSGCVKKARNLGVSQGIALKSGDKLQRWAAAVMIDKIWITNVKNNKLENLNKMLKDVPSLYTEAIVLANSKILNSLANSQITTDKGTYYLLDSTSKIELGAKYRFIIYDDKILKVMNMVKPSKKVTVSSFVGTTITCKNAGKTEKIVLPENTQYYYKGQKQGYTGIQDILQADSSLVLVHDNDKVGYEYAVIFDPVYKKPEICKNFDKSSKRLGSISFYDDPDIVRAGDIIDASGLEDNDVVYEVTDIWGSNRYILVVSSRTEGKLKEILPNKLSPNRIKIDDKELELGKDMELNKINSSKGAFKVNDNIAALMGYDNKVVDIIGLDHEPGKEVQGIILDESSSSGKAGSRQVRTNQGTFYLVDGSIKLETGNEYKLTIADDTIIEAGERLRETEAVTVLSSVESTIMYKNGDEAAIESRTLSDKTLYYHNGTNISLESIKDILQVDTSIIFTYNKSKTGYEYAIVIDPVYSNPKVGPSGFTGYSNIIKDGDLINYNQIMYNDVVYIVSDIWNNNPYLLVIANRQQGIISGFTPNRLSPKGIKIKDTDGVEHPYDLSEDMDFDKLASIKIGSAVTLLFGYDGEVVDIMKW